LFLVFNNRLVLAKPATENIFPVSHSLSETSSWAETQRVVSAQGLGQLVTAQETSMLPAGKNLLLDK
jgi:hypothetical protein